MGVLKGQMNIGLSAQVSGIPWWTTDIGGYHGGRAEDPTYHEIIVRWFQYGVTCPLFRQHGDRDHTAPWYYGNETEKLLEDIIRLRGDLKPYISSQLDLLSETARPFNRPLMWDFPEDPKTWELAEHGIGDHGHAQAASSVADQYMMGNDYMVAPVLNLGQRSRQVYFPRGATWKHYFSGKTYVGGSTAVIEVPLDNFALFKRLSGERLPHELVV
jgi:alpha-D-xyloside xylohydrolase